MEDSNRGHSNSSSLQRFAPNGNVTGPVRTRWTPKAEQILILESIFNSGVVNPTKDETATIRRLLEQLGPVGDANVFYWFQNRRSRSRRRQRQLQASLVADPRAAGVAQQVGGGVQSSSASSSSSSAANVMLMDDSAQYLFSVSRMGLMESTQSPVVRSSDVSQLHHQPGTVTVFIDGVLNEVPSGPKDLRAMFGQDVLLVHSSGELLPVNEHGILVQSLQMGRKAYLE
ncbi:WUSCHEL-related homeobox [Musa troglodytarum]|uniref:WUSCHEL-related homeobox n=2 Tax=Musa troglodytarum TaxID=320322 RepID=A0A9E7I3I6_9LILI|nr:WUSCHEL-related homeobox [Musa troglodytarum]